MSRFDVEEVGSYERVYESVHEALQDGDISLDKIDAVFVSSMELESNGERQRHSGPMISSMFQKRLPIITVQAGCGGGGISLWNAIGYQHANDVNNVMVIGFEKLVANTSENVTDEIFRGGERIYEQSEGMIFPAQNALVAQQYMLKYGATSDDMGLVALKNHENAFDNPKAKFYRKKITLDMIRKSPIVASPLRLFDCSVPCNGASTVIISRDKTDVRIAGSGMCTDSLCGFEREDMTAWESTARAARDAYQESSLGAGDIDLAEVHDAFTPIELMAYEDLGFAKKGKGVELVRNGTVKINGSLPTNTSGGLKARGHPISATGISQIYEITKQLRKQAGKRQVNAKVGLAHNVGGAGSMAAVHILQAT